MQVLSIGLNLKFVLIVSSITSGILFCKLRLVVKNDLIGHHGILVIVLLSGIRVLSTLLHKALSSFSNEILVFVSGLSDFLTVVIGCLRNDLFVLVSIISNSLSIVVSHLPNNFARFQGGRFNLLLIVLSVVHHHLSRHFVIKICL